MPSSSTRAEHTPVRGRGSCPNHSLHEFVAELVDTALAEWRLPVASFSHFMGGIFNDMGAPVPPIMPIFRSRLQGNLLALVLLADDTELSLTDLARRLDAPLSTVQREASRLDAAGVFDSRRVGNVRFVRANRRSPGYEPLRDLVERYFGVPVIIEEEFRDLVGIEELYIFGSWAERASGRSGPAPKDVDILAVGNPDRDAISDAALRAERRVGRQVNVTIRSADAWSRKEDGFLQHVALGSLVPIRRSGG